MCQQWNDLMFLPKIELDKLYHLGYLAILSHEKNKSLLVKDQFFASFMIKDGGGLAKKSVVFKNQFYPTSLDRIRASLFMGIHFFAQRTSFRSTLRSHMMMEPKGARR